MERATCKPDEQPKTVEREAFSESLKFDRVTIKLRSNDKTAIDFCTDYFHSYAETQNPKIQEPDWTIIDNSDEYASDNTWGVDEAKKEITISRKSSRLGGSSKFRAATIYATWTKTGEASMPWPGPAAWHIRSTRMRVRY